MRLVQQITVLDMLEELRLTNLSEVIMMKTKNISCPWIAVGALLLVLSCSKASDAGNRSVQQDQGSPAPKQEDRASSGGLQIGREYSHGFASYGPNPETGTLEGSGQMAWANGLTGYFIAGLDGALYEPYRAATIERIQQSLKARGLYAGPMNGILDSPTMKALYAFQEANHNLQLCGVPTPRTRKMLAQGSHTDVVS